MKNSSSPIPQFHDYLDTETLKLFSANGTEFVKQIGMEVIRGVVYDVLSGKNLRDSTEALTRLRIGTLNLAMMQFFINSSAVDSMFIENLPILATNTLKQKKITKAERWIAQWILGLTDKGVQNILRSNPDALDGYRDRYIQICDEVISTREKAHGKLTGELILNSKTRATVSWLFVVYFLNTIGSQTLTIRGSDKSSYGKLFEKLILGSLLQILGFKCIGFPPKEFSKVFWLSSRENKRESDATLLFEAGKGVRFDIGFIGIGNPEISLDKVTRFEREIVLGKDKKYFMATIILVDRIGAKSRIEELAKAMEGRIIQMSANYWPQQVAKILYETVGYEHELTKMPQDRIGKYLETKLKDVSLELFLGMAENEETDVEDSQDDEGSDTLQFEMPIVGSPIGRSLPKQK